MFFLSGQFVRSVYSVVKTKTVCLGIKKEIVNEGLSLLIEILSPKLHSAYSNTTDLGYKMRRD